MIRPVLFVCGDLHNLGDLALLLQNLEVAQQQARPMRVRRWQPLPAEIERQVMATGATLFDGRATGTALAAARGADVVIGGGQLVRDNMSPRSLAALAILVVTARATGGRVTLRGLGVGRIAPGPKRWLWRMILALSDRICVRDDASRDSAALLAPSARITRTADMAFLDSALHQRLSGVENASVTALVVAPCIDPSERRSIEGSAFAAIVAAAERRLGISALTFACHDPRPGMDTTAAERLRDGLDAPSATIHDSYDLDALFDMYRNAALVITNRLHAAIFSVLSDRPVLVIDDGTHKIAALAERFDIPSINADTAPDDVQADQLVAEAIGFDRQQRVDQRMTMAEAAARNLA